MSLNKKPSWRVFESIQSLRIGRCVFENDGNVTLGLEKCGFFSCLIEEFRRMLVYLMSNEFMLRNICKAKVLLQIIVGRFPYSREITSKGIKQGSYCCKPHASKIAKSQKTDRIVDLFWWWPQIIKKGALYVLIQGKLRSTCLP